jgi:molybdopterin-containing oxidoreductase family membrane subunit
MWFERFVIIVTSLHRDFLPSSWTMYTPTIVEFGILLGSFGLFFFFFFLFMKFLPSINMAELKSIVKTKHALELEKHYTDLLNNNHKMANNAHETKGDSVHGH